MSSYKSQRELEDELASARKEIEALREHEDLRREVRQHVQEDLRAVYARTEAELRQWIKVLIATLVSERRQCKRDVHALQSEDTEVEQILAEALGYPSDDYHGHGYATGEHTAVTLAMEAKRQMRADHRLIERLKRW